MDEEESDIQRAVRVKELEDMVRNLERENKQLLNKVKSTGAPSKAGKRTKETSREEDDLESGVLALNSVDQEDEDSWLYVSPKCPPTPKQLQVTPVKWFSEGHHHRGNGKPMDVPSLDDVRKSLTFHINEMENTALQPKTASPLSAVRHRKINQNGSSDDLKQTAHLRDSVSNSNEDIPKVNWAAPEQDPSTSKPEDDIPRVRWNPRTSSHDDDDKDVPRVRWRARPAASQVVENGDDIPKISWKKAAPRRINEEPVPKVKWDPNMAANLSEDEISEDEVGQDEVPVVNWKAPPSSTAAAAAADEDTVPVVKWRKPVQVPEGRQSASDVPVVKWNRNKQPSSPSPTEEEEVVPVIKWKAKQPATAQSQKKSIPSPQRQGRIPSTSPNRGGGGGEGGYERRRPSEENRETEQREQPQQRVSRLTAHQSGLQRPSHSSGSSPLRYRNTSPGQSIPTKPRDASPGQRPSLRSLSPSSPALRRSSRSPSPTTGTFNDRQILPQKLQRSPSPSRRSLVQPSTSRALASPSNSPQAVRTNHETSSSSSLPPRHQSGLPHPPSQRQLKHAQTEGTRTPPSAPKAATATAKRGLTPPGGGARSQQQPGGAKPSGSSLTPPSGRGKLAKRVLPNTPSGQSSPQGLQLPHKSSQQRRSLQRPQQQATPPQQPGGHHDDDDDNWLEGCF